MKDFKTRIKIKAELQDVWAAFTNPFTIELWSGYPAVMKDEAGFEFALWDGDIAGYNIEVIDQSRLVQEWFFGDQSEPSIVTIKFFEQGTSTQVEVVHTHIPDEAYDEITEGWSKYYLGAIKEFLEVHEV